jgi:ribosomal protein L44E
VSETETNLERNTAVDSRRRETSPNIPLVPDRATAEVISSLIDRARAAIGWARLNEKEQDITIITWFEICSDAGMRLEQYTPCYRAAQQRKRELVTQGQPLTIVTPHDLCAELDRVRAMHAELDKTRLLPENAAKACEACYGTGWRRMPNGSVKFGCTHEGLTPTEENRIAQSDEERRAGVKRQAELMREAMKSVGRPKPAAVEHEPMPKMVQLVCDSCGRKAKLLYREEGQRCGEFLNRGEDSEPPRFCEGTFVKA